MTSCGCSAPRTFGPRARLNWLLAVSDTVKIVAGLIAVTAGGALLERAWPALAGATAPHPTLHPTLTVIAGILATNLRVLALPFILTLTRFQTSQPSRLIGDALVLGVLGANAISIGVELGRWQSQLIAYLPHLPLEYLAAATAAAGWTDARRRQASHPRASTTYAASTVLLLAVAALVEVLLTPHAH